MRVECYSTGEFAAENKRQRRLIYEEARLEINIECTRRGTRFDIFLETAGYWRWKLIMEAVCGVNGSSARDSASSRTRKSSIPPSGR
jgi:hypothetical protein